MTSPLTPKYRLRYGVQRRFSRYGAGGFGVSAVGILPLQQGFSVYGKAGLLLARTELETNGSAGIATGGAR